MDRCQDHAGGMADLEADQSKGSSFAGFVRDEYTTLPESSDRPLFIFLDIAWSYEEVEDAWIGSGTLCGC